MNAKAAFAGSMFSLLSLCAHAGTPGDELNEHLSKNEINGSVFHTDNRKPIGRVVVTAYTANKKEMSVTTDASGHYYFDGLRPGTYRFVFERQGYRKVTRDRVIVRTDEGFRLNIGMLEEDEFNWLPGSFNMMGGE